jgi:DNA-binding MarR family transcriptional regulator
MASEAVKQSQTFTKVSSQPHFDVDEIKVRIEEQETVLDELRRELKSLASRPIARIISREVDAPIPVQESAVLDQLTGTELEVLTIIQSLGESSVPQIREQIRKTREHTARLLKKLFDKGFIDRNTSSMPYRYHIRKEIEELIQEQKKQLDLST